MEEEIVVVWSKDIPVIGTRRRFQKERKYIPGERCEQFLALCHLKSPDGSTVLGRLLYRNSISMPKKFLHLKGVFTVERCWACECCLLSTGWFEILGCQSHFFSLYLAISSKACLFWGKNCYNHFILLGSGGFFAWIK